MDRKDYSLDELTSFITKGELDSAQEMVLTITDNLKHMTIACRSQKNREALSEETLGQVVACLLAVLEQVAEKISTPRSGDGPVDASLPGLLDMAAEASRFVRNACAGCKAHQDTLHRIPNVFGQIQRHMNALASCVKSSNRNTNHFSTEKFVVLMKCCIQMLGNSTVGHRDNGALIWRSFFDEFSTLLQCPDPGVSSCTCMVIHSCLLANTAGHLPQLVTTAAGCEVICEVLSALITQDQEWGLFIIEKTLTHPELLHLVYGRLDDDQRNLLLDIMLSVLHKSHNNLGEDEEVPGNSEKCTDAEIIDVKNIKYICDLFKKNAYTILGLSRGTGLDREQSTLVTKQLGIICGATAIPRSYSDILEVPELIKCTINLLHCIHLIGQQGDNDFTSVGKVAHLSDTDSAHPVYGLKRDLIRLVANMTYKHRANQDKVRELGGIPVILDHTNIDGRNPFITQWSVFAIRNLLDRNLENQAVVAGMRLNGLANNVEQLRDFGVEADLIDGQVIIKNVDPKDSSPFAKGM